VTAVSSASEPRSEASSSGDESRRDRAGRYARRTRLYTWATVLVVAFVGIVILVAENTRRVKVGWIFGYSHVSLVYLILFAAILGWLLGLATAILFRRFTRPPR
jgi:uncharacterized integral membrane protein